MNGTGSRILSHSLVAEATQPTDIIKIQTRTLQDILEEHEAPHSIDYLSIDIEGAEERVLKEFPFTDFVFKCITIERPSNKLKDILSNNGYIMVKEIPDLDCYYIHKSYINEYKANKQRLKDVSWNQVKSWREFVKRITARHLEY